MAVAASAVTIRDVADAAGVSMSTVSLTLNHPGRVSGRTRDQVLRVIDELGFVPKAEAVARARRGVGRIGILGPFTSHPAAGRRLNGVLRGVAGSDLEIVVFDYGSASDSPEPFLAGLPRSGRLDGVLIVSLLPEEAVIEELLKRDLPTVLIDARHPKLSSVHTDDVTGGRLAAEHLLSLGARNYGFLGERQQSDRYISPAQRRLDGFRAALNHAGQALPVTSIEWSPRAFGEASDVAERLLGEQGPPPWAVFASDDFLAVAVMQAARRAGLRTPEDIAVVGFDDSDLADAMGLTTVRQPLEESGEVAVRLMTEQLRRPGPARSTFLELELVRRGST